jgi:predicted acyltransferase
MRSRLLSLDAFRGFTIAAMLLVNNPGDWGHVYAPLLHANWHGWTFTDWIFPFFVFISGISMTMSLGRRAQGGDDKLRLVRTTVRRGLVIMLLGLTLNFIPALSFETLRWPGVLQRLGLCTILCAPLAVYLNWRQQAWVGAALLVLYSLLMLYVPVVGADGVLRTGSLLAAQDTASFIDRSLMQGHLWAKVTTWDPEGLLSTLPAVASQIAGLLAGHWLAQPRAAAERTVGLFIAGLACLFVGEVLNAWNMPINKSLWTPAYTVAMSGWACLVFGVSFWLLDAQPSDKAKAAWARWLQPLVVYGMNALFLFVLSSLVAKMLGFIKIGGTSLKALLVAGLGHTGFAPVNVSLLFALGFVAVFYGIAHFMFQRQWFIKV